MATDAELAAQLDTAFREVYENPPDCMVLAPGRANLIGEHVDYNDGCVLPFAIDRQIGMAIRKRDDTRVRIYAKAYDAAVEFSLGDIHKDAAQPWSNFERGVIDVLQKAGYALSGADIWFDGDVPLGAGLSSSAAVEVATALAFNELLNLGIDRRDLALLAQKAENEFVGVQCGIMDQFASALSPPNGLLHLDCRSLECRTVPFDAPDIAMVLVNTNVQRSLAASKYNERRSECEEGVRRLAKHDANIHALRDVTPEFLDAHAGELPGAVPLRCRHVVEEIARVERCVAALDRGDFRTVGELVTASHESLRTLYEVSSRELDVLVDIALRIDGVYGARMVGAGFGGCVLVMVRKSAVAELTDRIEAKYRPATKRDPAVYACRIAPGARRIH